MRNAMVQEHMFRASFGTPDKPMTEEEFGEFWDSLTELEKDELWIQYYGA